MAKRKYRARENARLSDKDAEIIGRVLEKIGERSPKRLLKEASKKKSPIHHLFVWDDTEAAHLYRLWQARHMIGAIELIVNEHSVRAYHSIEIETVDREYKFHEHIINSKKDSSQMSEYFYNTMLATIRKVVDLELPKKSVAWDKIVKVFFKNKPDL